MATITRTPSNTWKALVRKQGWPTAIKTFRTKKDAADWARRTEDEMVRGIYIDRAPSERLTLKAAFKRYLAEVSPTKSKGTPRRERIRAKPLLEHLGEYAMIAVTPERIAEFRDERLAASKSRNTVRLELALLSHLFTVAIQEWRLGLTHNPVVVVRKPAMQPGRDRRLTAEEERALLAECTTASNPMLGWIVRLALYTGMRAGEIVSLQPGQVDLDRRVIRLDRTKNGSAPTVPLVQPAVDALREALAHQPRPEDTNLLFWGEPGRDRQRRPYEFYPAWRRALQRANITDLRFHDLRHEAVSRLVELGLGDQEVTAISGHKSMQMLRRYTHLRAEDLAVRLDELTAKPRHRIDRPGEPPRPGQD